MKLEWLLSKYVIGVALCAALGVGGYVGGLAPVFAYQLQEVRELVQSNSDTLALQRWQLLHAKAADGTINAIEQVEYCALSRHLGVAGIGCAL